jgi:hypothetical protein
MTASKPLRDKQSRTTTRRYLLRVGVVLVALTVLTATFALIAFTRAQRTADTVRTTIAPAIVAVSAARDALVEADRAAMTSFRTGAVRLAGPGDDYRNQIAIAGQNLTQAAQDITSDASRKTLGLVDGLLVSYTSSIEQAAASFRQSELTALWANDLWTASRLLHADGSVLSMLDGLRGTELSALDSRVGLGANTVLSTLSWLLPAIGLLVLLVVVQVGLRRRFRRTVNAGLAGATLCVLGMVAVAALAFDTGSRLDTTRDTAHQVADSWQRQVAARDIGGQRILADLMDGQCRTETGDCGSTVQRVVLGLRSASLTDLSKHPPTDGSARIAENTAAATENGDYAFLIPLTAAVAAALIAAGIYRRIDEYRYKSR